MYPLKTVVLNSTSVCLTVLSLPVHTALKKFTTETDSRRGNGILMENKLQKRELALFKQDLVQIQKLESKFDLEKIHCALEKLTAFFIRKFKDKPRISSAEAPKNVTEVTKGSDENSKDSESKVYSYDQKRSELIANLREIGKFPLE